MAGRWVDVGEAARELGISTDAVRKRIARGSLESDRPDGNVLVWLDDSGTEAGREAQVDGRALLEAKDETIALLRDQLRLRAEEIQRRDVIISQLTQANAALAQRVPELEAPQEPPGGPESAAEEPERAAELRPATRSAQGGPERPPDTAEWPTRGGLLRPWWRRVFGE
jgi:hypothetical protein